MKDSKMCPTVVVLLTVASKLVDSRTRILVGDFFFFFLRVSVIHLKIISCLRTVYAHASALHQPRTPRRVICPATPFSDGTPSAVDGGTWHQAGGGGLHRRIISERHGSWPQVFLWTWATSREFCARILLKVTFDFGPAWLIVS